jgi:hypothetical protein
MTRNEYIEKFFYEKCLSVLRKKGADYTEGLAKPSPNANFQAVTDMIDNTAVTKYTVWLVYFAKHLTALLKWIKKGTLASEPIEGRIVDMVNYLLILQSMQWEEQHKQFTELDTPAALDTPAQGFIGSFHGSSPKRFVRAMDILTAEGRIGFYDK